MTSVSGWAQAAQGGRGAGGITLGQTKQDKAIEVQSRSLAHGGGSWIQTGGWLSLAALVGEEQFVGDHCHNGRRDRDGESGEGDLASAPAEASDDQRSHHRRRPVVLLQSGKGAKHGVG